MNKHTFSLFMLSFILSFILLISCNHKLESYPIEPNIELKKIKIAKGIDDLGNHQDSVILNLHYSDGDSNLGRFRSCDTCYSDYNCTIAFYKKINGLFNLIEGNNPTHMLIMEMPKIPNSSYIMSRMRIKALNPYEGDIQMVFTFFSFDNPYFVGDTIKISLQVIDNDNNKSNITEMEKVYLYE